MSAPRNCACPGCRLMREIDGLVEAYMRAAQAGGEGFREAQATTIGILSSVRATNIACLVGVMFDGDLPRQEEEIRRIVDITASDMSRHARLVVHAQEARLRPARQHRH